MKAEPESGESAQPDTQSQQSREPSMQASTVAHERVSNVIWNVFDASERGANHIRRNSVNQDATGTEECAEQRMAIAAVSDGHGSPKYFRSDIGAKLAVEAALKSARLMASQLQLPGDGALDSRIAQECVRSIYEVWRESIERHIEGNPFTESEIQLLDGSPQSDSDTSPIPFAYGSIPYGATLLMALVVGEYFYYVQLGDGDILAVNADGTVHQPVHKRKSLISTETDSLCAPDAPKMFDWRFQWGQSIAPALILLCTDGYSESFSEVGGFEKAGRDFLSKIRSEGADSVTSRVGAWLRCTSDNGVGDDTSIALMWRSIIESPTRTDVDDIHGEHETTAIQNVKP